MPMTAGADWFARVEPRCKICRSPHRRQIDAMLVTGWSQAEVRLHWNEHLGEAVFSANNLSTHTGRHLNPRDPALWPIRSRCVALFLDDARQGDELGLSLREALDSALKLLESSGLQAFGSGLVEVEMADVIRAIQVSEQLDEIKIAGERAALEREREELVREFGLFTAATKAVLPESQWAELLEKFEQLIGEGGSSDATHT